MFVHSLISRGGHPSRYQQGRAVHQECRSDRNSQCHLERCEEVAQDTPGSTVRGWQQRGSSFRWKDPRLGQRTSRTWVLRRPSFWGLCKVVLIYVINELFIVLCRNCTSHPECQSSGAEPERSVGCIGMEGCESRGKLLSSSPSSSWPPSQNYLHWTADRSSGISKKGSQWERRVPRTTRLPPTTRHVAVAHLEWVNDVIKWWFVLMVMLVRFFSLNSEMKFEALL